MEARRRTWFDDRGLVVGDRHVPFYSGAMHYWRVEPGRWAACLRAMHGLGFTCVETYVPWRAHEPERGEYDWTGANDLPRFLDAARTAGLAVVIRPGPHVNAELTCFGMPDHVVGDPACQARTARDTPVWLPTPPRVWPVPSYAAAAFRERVRAWYAEVARVVVPHLAPDGPIVALGVDNEAQMFFRLGAYDFDYHPDAIAWWREASGFVDGEPPRAWDPADQARCVSWVQFKDQYIARMLGDLAGFLDEVGLAGIAKFHNLPPTDRGLYDLRAIQSSIAGPVGIDAYTMRSGFRELRRRTLAMTGSAHPIPIGFEVGVGFFPWFPPLDRGDDVTRERDQVLTMLAAGMRGFNLFMAVERDRYYGAAISAAGTVETHATWIGKLTRVLAEVDWPALRRSVPIAVVDVRADARFGLASSLLDPMTPVLGEALGLATPELGTDAGAITARRWLTAIIDALETAQVPYVLVDEGATEAELARYRAVIVPTIERVDRALWRRLHALADAKQTTVVIGPGTPLRDELDRVLDDPPLRRVGKLKAGSLDDLPGLAEDLAAVAGDPSAWVSERPEGVNVFAYSDGAATRVVFVTSDAEKPVTAVIATADAKQLRDPFTDEVIEIANGKAAIVLGARGVRMFVVD
ncbi:MAG: alpha-amylase family protein [Kofleriaceae bacterium]